MKSVRIVHNPDAFFDGIYEEKEMMDKIKGKQINRFPFILEFSIAAFRKFRRNLRGAAVRR